eukprot:TRINITY_DN1316_c0_g1_i1.p1 TRINITY_DN1316_c0_g1~~TRINITY_DN1316_c0_g1_i1.p1  ORF type:complete len:536 (-),score=158.35 TRINITY_DN1316_c0_g1_i1:35-1642(-)
MSSEQHHDHLDLRSNAGVAKMIKKANEGGPDETILMSLKITKFNKRDKAQLRGLLLTDRALYNISADDFTKCKRRIPLEKIGSITVSASSEEFVLHVPDEYDYRFLSTQKDDIVRIMKKAFKGLTGHSLRTTVVVEDELSNITWTKDKVKTQSREEIYKIKQKIASEQHDSDNEDQKDETVEELVNTSKDKKTVTVDDFDLLKVLGRGSFGKVLQVRKKDTGVIYAMKVLKKSYLVQRDQVEHTRSERKILEAMQHPFLMGLRYAFQTPTKLYLVMDFYRGGELFFHLKNKGKFSEDEAKIMIGEVAMALGHLHNLKFIYRDLKPENILMDDKGHVCLCDFGLSKDVDPNKGEFGTTFCGTPEYLAPEVIKGLSHDKAVDWWSLGILLYEIVIGIPPFYSQNVNEMYHKIQNAPLKFPASVSSAFRSLVVQLLDRNPATRLGAVGGFDEVKSHDFFNGIDWDLLLKKEVEPLYKPEIKSAADTSNFDPEFTTEPAVESLVPDSEIALAQRANFSDFTFINSSNKGLASQDSNASQ